MVSQAEVIIRAIFFDMTKNLGVPIDIPDEMIEDLATRLQAAINGIETAESESFEFLNELALAFRRGEKHARPQHTPILEGVRAVLAHLTATGRLIPDGGMALTAEQVEDVRTVANCALQYGNIASREAAARLRALFPATEPAEVNGNLSEIPNSSPAPAEPAEEETKAERDSQGIIRINGGRIVALSRDPRELVQQWYDLAEPGSKWQRDYAAALDLFDREAASSPVVPSPTETGPWQNVDAIQVGVPFEDKEGSQLVKLADGKFGYLSYPRETPETLAKYAPFVAAAEEG